MKNVNNRKCFPEGAFFGMLLQKGPSPRTNVSASVSWMFSKIISWYTTSWGLEGQREKPTRSTPAVLSLGTAFLLVVYLGRCGECVSQL